MMRFISPLLVITAALREAYAKTGALFNHTVTVWLNNKSHREFWVSYKSDLRQKAITLKHGKLPPKKSKEFHIPLSTDSDKSDYIELYLVHLGPSPFFDLESEKILPIGQFVTRTSINTAIGHPKHIRSMTCLISPKSLKLKHPEIQPCMITYIQNDHPDFITFEHVPTDTVQLKDKQHNTSLETHNATLLVNNELNKKVYIYFNPNWNQGRGCEGRLHKLAGKNDHVGPYESKNFTIALPSTLDQRDVLALGWIHFTAIFKEMETTPYKHLRLLDGGARSNTISLNDHDPIIEHITCNITKEMKRDLNVWDHAEQQQRKIPRDHSCEVSYKPSL